MPHGAVLLCPGGGQEFRQPRRLHLDATRRDGRRDGGRFPITLVNHPQDPFILVLAIGRRYRDMVQATRDRLPDPHQRGIAVLRPSTLDEDQTLIFRKETPDRGPRGARHAKAERRRQASSECPLFHFIPKQSTTGNLTVRNLDRSRSSVTMSCPAMHDRQRGRGSEDIQCATGEPCGKNQWANCAKSRPDPIRRP